MLEKILVELEEVNRHIKKIEKRLSNANQEILRIRSLGYAAAAIDATEEKAVKLISEVMQLGTF